MAKTGTKADRSLPPVLNGVRDFEHAFADAIQNQKDIQITLRVAVRAGSVKFVRLTEERNYELDET